MNKTIFNARYLCMISLFKQRRLALGMRQVDVAGRLGWDRNTIARIESRQRRLDVMEAHLLATALGLKLHEIVKVLEINAPHRKSA